MRVTGTSSAQTAHCGHRIPARATGYRENCQLQRIADDKLGGQEGFLQKIASKKKKSPVTEPTNQVPAYTTFIYSCFTPN